MSDVFYVHGSPTLRTQIYLERQKFYFNQNYSAGLISTLLKEKKNYLIKKKQFFFSLCGNSGKYCVRAPEFERVARSAISDKQRCALVTTSTMHLFISIVKKRVRSRAWRDAKDRASSRRYVHRGERVHDSHEEINRASLASFLSRRQNSFQVYAK